MMDTRFKFGNRPPPVMLAISWSISEKEPVQPVAPVTPL